MWLVDNIAFPITVATAFLVVLVAFERKVLSAVRLGRKIFYEVSCLTKKNFNLKEERIPIT